MNKMEMVDMWQSTAYETDFKARKDMFVQLLMERRGDTNGALGYKPEHEADHRETYATCISDPFRLSKRVFDRTYCKFCVKCETQIPKWHSSVDLATQTCEDCADEDPEYDSY